MKDWHSPKGWKKFQQKKLKFIACEETLEMTLAHLSHVTVG